MIIDFGKDKPTDHPPLTVGASVVEKSTKVLGLLPEK